MYPANRLFLAFVFALNAAACGAILFFSTVAYAVTWTVPVDASTIQSAIGLAASGDTIEVEPGTYTGLGNRDIDFGGKSLVLRSVGGALVTILDCQSSGRGFLFDSGETNASVVDGFTITNGRAAQGGGVMCNAAAPTFLDCVLSANRADQAGGGVACAFGAAPRLTRCTFEGNSAFFSGGGISCINASADIRDCVFSANSAGLLGGGIYCREASPSITRCEVVGNVSNGGGGGLVFYHFSASVVTECVVAGNRANGSAGAVFCDDEAAPTFVDCVVTGNHTEFNGGGILCTGRSTATIRGSTLSGNRAVQAGGGLHAEDVSAFACERSILWGNCAATDDEAHLVDAASRIEFSCSDVDSFGVGGAGVASYVADNIVADPLFCSPRACITTPISGGDYGLDGASPCLPAASPCGLLIGAIDAACGFTSVSSSNPILLQSLTARPNPARDGTTLRFRLAQATEVRVDVYDLAGRRVRELFHGELGQGEQALRWDGRAEQSARLPSGVYVLRLELPRESRAVRVTRLR